MTRCIARRIDTSARAFASSESEERTNGSGIALQPLIVSGVPLAIESDELLRAFARE